jgi:hypothetical protein
MYVRDIRRWELGYNSGHGEAKGYKMREFKHGLHLRRTLGGFQGKRVVKV